MLGRNTEALLDAALSSSPIQLFFNWKAARSVRVLAYHGVDDTQCFEQHLVYLHKHMNPVTIEQLIAALEDRGTLPELPVLVTFDDGYRSVLENAMPLMRHYNIPGVVFVVAGLLNTDTPLWTAEVKELASRNEMPPEYAGYSPHAFVQYAKEIDDYRRLEIITKLRKTSQTAATPVLQLETDELRLLEANGIAVGNHTTTHPCLTQCSPEKVRNEITQAHRILTDALGHEPLAFAYPNGDFTDAAATTLADLGYRVGFLFDHRLSPLKYQSRFCTSRLRVNSDTSMDRFRTIVSGLHPALHHAIGRS